MVTVALHITKPNLISTLRMSSTIADSYQPRNAISINAIANIGVLNP